uniref:Scaffoldin C n=1 Tax=Ruminococcus flavefaciens TaxID=1265 RepID=G9FDP7_RUMFL|nr:scaffoldin C [Ruminococcus flavefaciens]
MKTKRIVIGAMAAMMFSTSICSLATAAAADDTVQIIVGNTTAKAGGEYELEVSLADIPTTGAQGINFSLGFDKSLISVESVEIGTLANTAAVNADSTGASLPVFDTYIDNENGFISLIWSTSSKDASYWLQGSGVFCTIKGTASASAKDGDKADVKVAAVGRDTYSKSGVANTDIDCGYFKDGRADQLQDKLQLMGYVQIGEKSDDKYLRGDANCNGKVDLSDAVAILQSMLHFRLKYPLGEQGLKNAECDGKDGVNGMDALEIQKYDAG